MMKTPVNYGKKCVGIVGRDSGIDRIAARCRIDEMSGISRIDRISRTCGMEGNRQNLQKGWEARNGDNGWDKWNGRNEHVYRKSGKFTIKFTCKKADGYSAYSIHSADSVHSDNSALLPIPIIPPDPQLKQPLNQKML